MWRSPSGKLSISFLVDAPDVETLVLLLGFDPLWSSWKLFPVLLPPERRLENSSGRRLRSRVERLLLARRLYTMIELAVRKASPVSSILQYITSVSRSIAASQARPRKETHGTCHAKEKENKMGLTFKVQIRVVTESSGLDKDGHPRDRDGDCAKDKTSARVGHEESSEVHHTEPEDAGDSQLAGG